MAITLITSIATGFAAAAGVAGLTFSWAAFAISAGFSLVARALTPKPDLGTQMGGQSVTTREAAQSRKIVYGRARIGGNIVYLESTGTDNKYLYLVIAVAGHEIDAYESVWFNDEKIWNGSNYVGNWGDYVNIGFFKGDQTTADNSRSNNLVGASDSKWTNDHKLLDTAYMVVRLTHDVDKFASGLPNISTIIRGKKVLHTAEVTAGNFLLNKKYKITQVGTTNFVSLGAASNTVGVEFIASNVGSGTGKANIIDWSQNPALCIYDYLRDAKYGLGETAANILTGSVIAAKTICDQSITLANNTTQARYTINGVVDTSATIKSNIELMIASMAGRLIYASGQFEIHAGNYVAPAFTVDESQIVGDITVQTKQSRRNAFNGVKGVFLSEEDNYILADYPAQISSSFATEDGDPIYLDMALPFTTNHVRAQRLAKLALFRSRQQEAITIPCNLSALRFKIGDNIKVSNVRLGYDEKVFEVVGYSMGFDAGGTMGVDVQAIETAPSIWDWTASDEEVFLGAGEVELYSGTVAKPPTSVQVASDSFLADDGTFNTAFNVSWTSADDAFTDRYLVEWKLTSASAYFSTTTKSSPAIINNLQNGETYNVRVTAINELGVSSTPVSPANPTVASDTTAPNAPTSVSANGEFEQITINWTNPTVADFSHVLVYRSNTSNGTYALLEESSGTTFVDTGLLLVNELPVQKFYKLRSVDNSGNATKNAQNQPVYSAIVNATTTLVPIGGIADNAVDTDQIADLAVQTDQIDNNQVTIAKIAASLQSTNYVSGSAGWKILKSGVVEFEQATIRGSITANDGEIGGFDIAGTYLKDAANTMGLSSVASSADDVRFWAGNTFANRATAPFFVTKGGALKATKITVSGTAPLISIGTNSADTITLSTASDYRMWVGSSTPENAKFSVHKDGTLTAKGMHLQDGNANAYFSPQGFTDLAYSEIAANTASRVSKFESNLVYNLQSVKVTLIQSTSLTLGIKASNLFSGLDLSSVTIGSAQSMANALADIPDNFTLTIQKSTTSAGSGFTNVASQQYLKVTDATSATTYLATSTQFVPSGTTTFATPAEVDVSSHASVTGLDENGDRTLENTATYAQDIFWFRVQLTTTDTSYDTSLNNLATWPRSFLVEDNGSTGFNVISANEITQAAASGDITGVEAGTNLNGGGESGDVILNLDSTITGDHTFSNNLIIEGNLTVQGTTTTVDTDDLNVKDKNITLNYSTGDSSSSANGAGITIQDAVDASTNATILWDSTNDKFDFSHKVNAPSIQLGADAQPTLSGDGNTLRIQTTGGYFDIGANNSGFAHLLTDRTNFYFNRRITVDTGEVSSYDENLTLMRVGSTTARLRITAGSTISDQPLSVTGNIAVTGTVDGVDIAARNGVLTSTTTTANAALPKAGGSMSGTLSSNSNIETTLDMKARILYSKVTNNSYLDLNSANNVALNSSGAVNLTVGGATKFQARSTGALVYAGSLMMGSNATVVIDASRNLLNIGTISSGAITSSGQLIVNKPSVSLANQPSIISKFDSTGTDGYALISVEHLTNSGAAAMGAGVRFKVGDGTSGTADKESYIIQRGGGQLPLVYVADKSHEFYVDHHDNSINGTSYSDYGTLALTLTETGNATFAGTINSGNITAGLIGAGGIPVTGYALYARGSIAQDSGSMLAFGNVVAGMGYVKAASGGSGGYYVASQQVIDGSRNLLNIGTISSGAITSTGTVKGTIFTTDASNSTYFLKSRASSGTAISVEGTIFASGSFDGTAYKRGGVTFLGPSNNLIVSSANVSGLIEFDSLSGTGSVAITNILDEDDMASNSATALATQQSIKAYVLANVNSGSFLPLSGGAMTGAITSNSNFETATDVKARVYYSKDTNNGYLYFPSTSQAVLNSSASTLLAVGGATKLQVTATGTNVFAGTLSMGGQEIVSAARNLTIGTISSGAITASADINITAGTLKLKNDVALDHDGSSLYIKAPSAIYFYPSNTNRGNIDTSGKITLNAYAINGTTVIDASRNIFASQYYYLNAKIMAQGTDGYLRINQSNQFGNGCWFGNSNIYNSTNKYIASGSNGGTTTSRVYMYGGAYNGTNVIALDGSDGKIKGSYYTVGSTTVIDASRNHFGSQATFSGKTTMGGDGAIVQIANSTAADTSNTYTLAVGSQSGNKSILAARDINTSGGGYQINGTTVINSNRQLRSINGIYNTSDVQIMDLGNVTYTILKDPEGSIRLYLGDTGDAGNYYDNTAHTFRNRGNATQVQISDGGVNLLNTSATYKVQGTTVINASRNITMGSSLTVAADGGSNYTSNHIRFMSHNTARGAGHFLMDDAGANTWYTGTAYSDAFNNWGVHYKAANEDEETAHTQRRVFSVSKVGNAVFSGTINSGAITSGNIGINGDSIGRSITDTFTLNGRTQPHYGFNLAPVANSPIGMSGYYGIAFASVGVERLRISNTGLISITNAVLQMSGSTVIDASRNLTNIGTISSNSTVVSKNLVAGLANGTFSSTKTIGALHIANGAGSSGGARQSGITFQGDDATQAQAGIYVTNDNSSGTHMAFATTNSYSTGPQFGLTISNVGVVNIPRNALQFGGNTAIDANRNLTVGTISSGNITAGLIGAGGAPVSGYALYARGSIAQDSGSMLAFGNVVAGMGFVKANSGGSGGYYVASQQVIDGSRNLTNIGTITTNNILKVDAGHGTARMQLVYDDQSAISTKGTLTAWVSEPGLTYSDAGIGANIHVSGQYYGRAFNDGYGVYARFRKSNGAFEVWNTQGTSGANGQQGTQRLNLSAAGVLNLPTGSLNVQNVEVISSGRNLLNIGTISSGAISGTSIQMSGDINASGVSANNVSGNVFKIGTTTVITASRALTNIASYNGYYPTSSASSTNSVISADNRSVNSSPSAISRGFYVDFKNQSTIGLTGSGSYAGVLTFRSYGSGTDLSGGYPIQIAYDQAGNLQTRYGSSATAWNAWKAIHVAGNNLTAGTISSGAINITSGGLRIGTTEVIDSSRNIKNIGSSISIGSTAVRVINGPYVSGNVGLEANSTSYGCYMQGGTTNYAYFTNVKSVLNRRMEILASTSQGSTTPNIKSKAQGNGNGVTQYHINFTDSSSTVDGRITSNGYATSYTTTSDYRVKEDERPMSMATPTLLALRPINFQWKGSDLRTDGFFAHEVAELVPDAVVGEKDATEEVTDDDDVTTTVESLQALDQAKLIPLLVKTIQELEARITALESA